MKKKILSAIMLFVSLAVFTAPAMAAKKKAAGSDFVLVRGTISAINAKARTITVRQENKKEISATYSPSSSTVWVGYEDVDFTDLKKGQLVDMECAGPEKSRVVNWVEIYETQDTALQS